jgi:hypothetical protein
MDAFRASAVDERTASRAALEQIATLHLSAFPETILPNKLVTELVALAKGAELPLPLTNELAADIFMGSFSPRFAEAARIAATLMAGTAYERYYAIPYERVRAFGGEGVPAEQQLAELCAERAGQAAGGGRGLRTPAANGMIIEQQQLVTTHNLAQLFSALDLRECLAPDLRHLAERSFRFVCRALDAKLPTHHARLRAVKDAAYAWRQMLFFLSFIGEDELFGFRVWAEETLSSHSPELVLRFGPAWRGLSHVLDGGALDARGEGPDGARAFLGWSTSPHWLLA